MSGDSSVPAWESLSFPGAGVTAALGSVSTYATTVPTSTVSPSWIRTSTRVPDSGEGISASTLSVEISRIGSSLSTASPTCFSHFDTVPSAIDSPIWGMGTSIRATSALHREIEPTRARYGQRAESRCAGNGLVSPARRRLRGARPAPQLHHPQLLTGRAWAESAGRPVRWAPDPDAESTEAVRHVTT